jgi:RNA polymerase II subunit A small phosphatase-like protein
LQLLLLLQVLNIESLAVDPHLSTFVDQLRMQLKPATLAMAPHAAHALGPESDAMTISTRTSSCSSLSADAAVLVVEDEPGYLLPPQLPHHVGRMTVLLDLDGTLVSSFAPRKAPRLPRSMVTHLVGVGTTLNPGGVFVVERPGLTHFLEQLASFTEVVVFTAGDGGGVGAIWGMIVL